MGIERTEFSSGLRVVTERMPSVRSVSLGFWVLAGSRDEPPAISGSSHFLEHLLFKGTKTRSAREIAEDFDAVGGDVNAFTSKEYTCYYARVLDGDLEMAVDHLADMFQHSVLRSGDLDAERQVILEEINMHEDSPEEVVHDLFTETLWPSHPLGRPVLGTAETIRAATREKVHRFYRRHYVPGGLVVAAAGNLRHEDLLARLRERMDTGRIVRTGDPQGWNLRASKAPPESSSKPLVKRRKTEQAHICLGTNGLARSDPDRFPFQVVNGALGTGMSSRLFQEIREKRGLVYSVYSYHSQYTEAGQFACYAGTTPARAREVIGLLRRELDDVAEGGLTAEEFERAKGHVRGSMVLSLEDPGSRMSRIGKSEISHGEILTVTQALKRVEDVTLEDARRVAKRVLSQPMTLTVVGPFGQRDLAGSHGVIRVGVIGATGKVGAEVCRAVHADADLELVAGISRSKAGEPASTALGLEGSGLVLADDLSSFVDAEVEVAVDFTSGSFAPEHVAWSIEHGVHIVVGTTGFEIDEGWRQAPVGVFVAPNFAIGAVLMQRFAREAAPHLPAVEIVELHHDGKSDAPSGTAAATADAVAAARVEAWSGPSSESIPGARGGERAGIRIHSIRLPGLVAHQEVIFGGQGQTLTIRHDSTDRTSFVPGVLMAIRWVPDHPGLTVGLDAILET